MIRTLVAAGRFEFWTLRRNPADLMALFNVPLFTFAFLAITSESGRHDLLGYAVLAPTVIAVWNMALLVSGELIDVERSNGTLEALISTPARYEAVLLGRISTVTTVSMLSLFEAWLVGWTFFDILVVPDHRWQFALVLLLTIFAMAGMATAMAAFFVLAKSARTFQNSLSYPFFVLGGVLVPVHLLPEWLQPVARMIFLSWSSDLLRDSLHPEPIRHFLARCGAVVLLGGLSYVIGFWILRRVLDRVRSTGQVTRG